MNVVVTLGEALIDFVSTSPGTLETVSTFEKMAGGAPANVAACVARLGGAARFVGKRGNDPFGRYLNQVLTSYGVDTRFFTQADGAGTGLAFVALTEQGERSFAFVRDGAADTCLTPQDVFDEVFADAAILHVGSVSLATQPARDATVYAVKQAKKLGKAVSFDPNWRPALWENPDDGAELVQEIAALSDVVKVNRDEMCLFTGYQQPELGAKHFHDIGVSLVLITLDVEGCFFSVRTKSQEFNGYISGRSVNVVDTTGAGDAFTGAMLFSWARDNELLKSPVAVQRSCELAVAVSARTVLKRGAMSALPTLSEISMGYIG